MYIVRNLKFEDFCIKLQPGKQLNRVNQISIDDDSLAEVREKFGSHLELGWNTFHSVSWVCTKEGERNSYVWEFVLMTHIDSNGENYFWGRMSNWRRWEKLQGRAEVSLLLWGTSPEQQMVMMEVMVKGYRASNRRTLCYWG